MKSTTYNHNIISLHDQASGQEHGPKHGFLVFLQSLTHSQQPVGCVTFLRMVNEIDCSRIAQVQSLELVLGRNDLFCRHSDLDVVCRGRRRAEYWDIPLEWLCKGTLKSAHSRRRFEHLAVRARDMFKYMGTYRDMNLVRKFQYADVHQGPRRLLGFSKTMQKAAPYHPANPLFTPVGGGRTPQAPVGFRLPSLSGVRQGRS